MLSVDDFVPFSHWVPPPETPKRFSTWFFLAALPPGAADVVIDGGEIGDHVWTTPTAALDRHRAGEIEVAPPTWVTLHRLVGLADADAALADVRGGDVEHFATHVASDDGVLVALWAPDAGYESRDPSAPGARHRLRMDPAGWRYERTA